MSRHRSNAADLQRRIDAAALLLADGVPRTAAVTQLAERYGVDRRTARRYVAAGAQQLVVEIGTADLQATLAESVERLRRLAYMAEQQGNLNAAVGAERLLPQPWSRSIGRMWWPPRGCMATSSPLWSHRMRNAAATGRAAGPRFERVGVYCPAAVGLLSC